jgi:hypothetical protein
MADTSAAVERVYPPRALLAVTNPILKSLIATRIGGNIPGLARLDFVGRRTGKPYRVVAGIQQLDGKDVSFTNSGWRLNFRGGHPVELVRGNSRRASIGNLEEDPDRVANVFARRIDELGYEHAARRLGIRINVQRSPTHDELVEFVRTSGMSILQLRPTT